MLDAAYEGRRGASAREIQAVLNDAALDEQFRCLSPLAIIQGDPRDDRRPERLRLSAPRGGRGLRRHRAPDRRRREASIAAGSQDEVQDAAALVEEKEYERLFEDYFVHVKAFDSNEKVKHRQTGAYESPNEELMNEVEQVIAIKEKPAVWRKSLIFRIAGWAIEHPRQPIAYQELFRDIFRALKAAFYKKRESSVAQIEEHILRFGTEDWPSVPRALQKQVIRALARMKVKYGYCEMCAKEVLSYVLKHREP